MQDNSPDTQECGLVEQLPLFKDLITFGFVKCKRNLYLCTANALTHCSYKQ